MLGSFARFATSASATKKPELHHLRDSGNLEYDADNVILMSEGDRDLVKFNVEKQRNGRRGTVTMRLRGECYRFEELVNGYDNYEPTAGTA